MGSDEVEWVSELQNNLLLYASPNLDEELTIQYEVANSDGRVESFYCVIGATAKTSSGAAESADVIFSLDKETAILWNTGKFSQINLDKDYYVFTGSTVGVVPIVKKGIHSAKIEKLGSVKANIV